MQIKYITLTTLSQKVDLKLWIFLAVARGWPLFRLSFSVTFPPDFHDSSQAHFQGEIQGNRTVWYCYWQRSFMWKAKKIFLSLHKFLDLVAILWNFEPKTKFPVFPLISRNHVPCPAPVNEYLHGGRASGVYRFVNPFLYPLGKGNF